MQKTTADDFFLQAVRDKVFHSQLEIDFLTRSAIFYGQMLDKLPNGDGTSDINESHQRFCFSMGSFTFAYTGHITPERGYKILMYVLYLIISPPSLPSPPSPPSHLTHAHGRKIRQRADGTQTN